MLIIKNLEGLKGSLNDQADKIFEELTTKRQAVAEILFKALTDLNQSNLYMRRPISIAELVDQARCDTKDIIDIVETFRKDDRNLLTPIYDELHADSIIDITHESLIRQWDKLNKWVKEEAESAQNYKRLLDDYQQKQNGGDYLVSHALHRTIEWRNSQKPNEYWAERYWW